MSSPCLSGGGRTYGFDLEIVKSPFTTSTRTSHTSSPSSTLSDSCNSPLVISTRKARTPRKRPNQTYNEAAALLSTVYPNIFSTNQFATNNHRKSTNPPQHTLLLDDPSDLLLPLRVFDNSGFLLHRPMQEKPSFTNESKAANLSHSCDKHSRQSSGEVDFHGNSMEVCEGRYQEDDFDAESILDEEVEEGIDSIMGNSSARNETVDGGGGEMKCWHPMGFNFGGKLQSGMRRGVRAFRNFDEGDWWCFPPVDMLQISPRLNNNNDNNNNSKQPNSNSNSYARSKLKSNSSEKKRKKKAEKAVVAVEPAEAEEENWIPAQPVNDGLLLKLNYKEVLNAWSDRGCPFGDEGFGSEGKDVSARLAEIDLFLECGGVREASVLRYKEKRRTRLFSKKIRYQVRKVNADRRPRMKGRFVGRPNSSTSGQRREE